MVGEKIQSVGWGGACFGGRTIRGRGSRRGALFLRVLSARWTSPLNGTRSDFGNAQAGPCVMHGIAQSALQGRSGLALQRERTGIEHEEV